MAARQGRGMLVGGLAIGVVLSAGCAFLRGGVTTLDTKTPISLRPEGPNGACILTAKEAYIRGKKNHKVDWEVRNHCSTAQTIALGNFRTAEQPPPPDNCDASTFGGATWPFKGSDTINRRRVTVNAGTSYKPSKGRIQLTIDPEVPGDEVKYFYDVCLGGSKADPVLIIER